MSKQTQKIIVIGTDNTRFDSPLAEALSAIGAAFKSEMRVFVAPPTGTYEYDRKQELIPAVECARRVLASKNSVLLFDAVSMLGECEPASGLLPWLSYYRALHGEVNPVYINFDSIITTFFIEEDHGIWWSGFNSPPGYTIQELAMKRWGDVMGGLVHDSEKGRTGQ